MLRVYFENANVQLLITLNVCVTYSGQGAKLQSEA